MVRKVWWKYVETRESVSFRVTRRKSRRLTKALKNFSQTNTDDDDVNEKWKTTFIFL